MIDPAIRLGLAACRPPPTDGQDDAAVLAFALRSRRITIVGKSPCSRDRDPGHQHHNHSHIRKHGTPDRKLHLRPSRELTKSRANARVPPSQQAQRRYATVAFATMNTSLTQPQREGLDTKFKCVFCNSEDSISTKIDKKAGVASLSCKNCVQSYQMSANCMPRPQ